MSTSVINPGDPAPDRGKTESDTNLDFDALFPHSASEPAHGPMKPWTPPWKRERAAKPVKAALIEQLDERLRGIAHPAALAVDTDLAEAVSRARELVEVAREARAAFDQLDADRVEERAAYEHAALASEPFERVDFEAETIRRHATLADAYAAAERAVAGVEELAQNIDRNALREAARELLPAVEKSHKAAASALAKAEQAAAELASAQSTLDTLAHSAGMKRWTAGLGVVAGTLVREISTARQTVGAIELGASWFEESDGIPAATRRSLAEGNELDQFVLAHIEALDAAEGRERSGYLSEHHRNLLLARTGGEPSVVLVRAFTASKGSVREALAADERWRSSKPGRTWDHTRSGRAPEASEDSEGTDTE
ncbi:hypothetical protein [Aeromicrobium sp. HA]|uniref:hypothetical protein n=1 Tax=Aeromicrobium sp. HA TaxID=3009077 RepID=UPI0022AF780A|nr:hypothetical protein [Aeromicrobium sp. HA]